MTSERVVRALRAAPFQPFRLWLADGEAIDVRHPEQVMAAEGGRTVLVDSSSATAERRMLVDLLLVVALEFSAASPVEFGRSSNAR
ncbi:MAG: hypothetical protein U0572_15625 [Phycisphaerales bacterium]